MSRFHRGNDIDHATRKKYDTWKQNAGKMQVLLKGFRTDDIASLTKDSVQDMFNRIDTDGSGTINADEMKAYFNELGAELDDATVAALLDEADSNHSRDIDLDEFHGACTSLGLLYRYCLSLCRECLRPSTPHRTSRRLKRARRGQAAQCQPEVASAGACYRRAAKERPKQSARRWRRATWADQQAAQGDTTSPTF